MTKTQETKIEKPVWLKYTEAEIKAIILKLAEKGLTSEKIGLILRDQYGIPKAKFYNIKISKILKESKKYNDPIIKNLDIKLAKIIKHFEKNKQDKKAERALIITKAKFKKIKDYNKKRENVTGN